MDEAINSEISQIEHLRGLYLLMEPDASPGGKAIIERILDKLDELEEETRKLEIERDNA